MKNKIPCEVIRDLFPSYIDKLTSEKTNEQIEEHISECDDCMTVLNDMNYTSAESIETENKKEIDFLKKTRKKNRKIISVTVLTAVLAVLVIAAVMLSGAYFIESYLGGDFVDYDFSVTDNVIHLEGRLSDEELAVKEVEFTEENGLLNIKFLITRKSFLSGDEAHLFDVQHAINEEIKEITVDGRTVWYEGTEISGTTADLFAAAHPYIGDMSQNGKSAGALNIGQLGHYINELQTSKEPYEWKFIFSNSFSSERKSYMEDKLKSYAYALLATIDNLNVVKFKYFIEGEELLLTVTTNDADEFMGESVKETDNIAQLQRLMEKAGLDDDSYLTYINPGFYDRWRDYVPVFLTNESEDIEDVTLMCYDDGRLLFTQKAFGEKAYGYVDDNPQLTYNLIAADFGEEKWEGRNDVELKLALYDEKGTEHIADVLTDISLYFGSQLNLVLGGDVQSGYEVRVGTMIK